MPYQLLLVVERPDLSIVENKGTWEVCLKNIENSAKRYTNLTALGENVLLLTIDGPLSSVADALSHLNGIDYKYALFDTEIQWHEVTGDS